MIEHWFERCIFFWMVEKRIKGQIGGKDCLQAATSFFFLHSKGVRRFLPEPLNHCLCGWQRGWLVLNHPNSKLSIHRSFLSVTEFTSVGTPAKESFNVYNGLNSGSKKICPNPNLWYCECDLIWKWGLCRCNYVVKDVEMRSSWISQMGPKSSEMCPYKRWTSRI